MEDFFMGLFNTIFSFLPDSPFQKAIYFIVNQPFLKYLNWLIPIDTFITIGGYWLTAIGCYYIYQVILRWIKAVE